MKIILVFLCLTLTLQAYHKNSLRQCPCDQQGCPSCMLASSLKKTHENAEIINLEDADQQKRFADSAELQNKLFAEAEKYAKECTDLEVEAQELASKLQSVAQKAQIARNKYLKIQTQAKQVALKTLQTVQVHTPIYNNLKVIPIGVKTRQIIQNTPQYQVSIAGDDLQTNVPESVEDANLQQELSNSIIG